MTTVNERAARIRMVVLDIDGVMSDGTINVSGTGELYKSFYVRDGLGIKMLQKHGITISLPGISLFIKRHKNKYDPKAEPQKKRVQTVKASRSSKKLTTRLQALEKVLVRDSSEVAREYDRKRSQLKKKTNRI